MSFSLTQSETLDIPGSCRDWLGRVADKLIPASATMPAASEAGVRAGQLDVALRARPDLVRGLLRAWLSTSTLPPSEALEKLKELDGSGYQAVLLIVAGSYYSNPEVRDLLGYSGQQPRTVQIADDIDEEMLLRVIERGSIYRPA
ncbi:hypothetical protein LWC35_14720 [Pseudonocardia kujensis]|uniref:hypothetical protein n=1 Tax=Pseudonocardia kujensis TaxID=1128675 RepID=UPI001E4329A7|nr:hypothetical protein [Pseudonocardia kujensis]MCE0764154.1 hypothetical protein [Pseudonocardia kujensis]